MIARAPAPGPGETDGSADTVAKKRPAGNEPVTIKKYANRRLYNTATSSYVTLDHLAEMVRRNQDFVVIDAKTGEDITRSVLTQIIFEEEAKTGQSLLPIRFMRQLIKFYGDSLQGVVPSFLDLSMENFAREQERLRNRLASAVGEDRLQQLEGQVRENLTAIESAVRMFNPFSADRAPTKASKESGAADSGPADDAEEIASLRAQMAAMQKQLDALSRKRKP